MNARPEAIDPTIAAEDRAEEWQQISAIRVLRKALEDNPEGMWRSDVVTLARKHNIEWRLMWKVAAIVGVQRCNKLWQLGAHNNSGN
jgi:hypothetical protein